VSEQVIIGKKRDDVVYVPCEVRIRMLVTADFFEVGGEIEDSDAFDKLIQSEVVRRVATLRDNTYPLQGGEIRIAVVTVGPVEPAEAR
jgi:hypothetical protein